MKTTTTNTVLKPVTRFAEFYTGGDELQLFYGGKLKNINVAYQTFGELNDEGTNVVLICHALTGNSHAAGIISEDEIKNSEGYEFLKKYNKMFFGKPGWWDPLIGPGKVFDTNKYYVICSNFIGSCYGTTGPGSLNPDTGELYNMNLPQISVRDMVEVQYQLIKYLGVNKIKTVTGGSLGAMQVLEWAAMHGNILDSIIPIAGAAAHSSWAIGLNDAARDAIKNDPGWNNGNYTEQPVKGLSLARKIAMISYRSFVSFKDKFGREIQSTNGGSEKEQQFAVESYLEYQGEKFINRFDANSYLYIINAMDKHDMSLERDKLDNVLGDIKTPALCVGIDTDVLYPAEEQKEIASKLGNGTYAELRSPHGHDSFLIAFTELSEIIYQFLTEQKLL